MNYYNLDPLTDETTDEYQIRLKKRFDEFNEFIEYMKEFADDYSTEFGSKDSDIDHVEIYDGNVVVDAHFDDPCGFGPYSRNFSFPVDYLWNTDWKYDEKNVRHERLMKELRDRAEKETEQAITDKEQRRKSYLELKKEFEQEETS